MEPDIAICYLLAGGECIRDKQPYTIIYKDGKFQTKETGTLIGNFNGLKKKED